MLVFVTVLQRRRPIPTICIVSLFLLNYPEDSFSGPDEYYSFEAEKSSLTSPMASGLDPDASGGGFMFSSQNESGHSDFTFSVQGGEYVVWARAKAGTPNPTGHDSFHLSMDGSQEETWHFFFGRSDGPATNWEWGVVKVACDGSVPSDVCGTENPRVFSLARGAHTLRLRSREAYSYLDKILITSDLDLDPTNNVYTPSTNIAISLSWSPPTSNTDNTPLTDLGGYKVYYGEHPTNYSTSVDIGNQTTYSAADLVEGKVYYFSVTAYNTSLIESELAPVLAWKYGDRDIDGLPDAWETNFFGGIQVSGAFPEEDFDGDGISNYDEFISGSRPDDAHSFPFLEISGTNGQTCLSFYANDSSDLESTGYDRYYKIERHNLLISGSDSWEQAHSYDVLGGGQSVTILDPFFGAQSFYRLKVWLESK